MKLYETISVSSFFITSWENAMAFVPTTNAVEVVIAYARGGDLPVSNSLWFTHPAISAINMADLGEEIQEWFVDTIMPELSASVTYVNTIITQKNIVGGAQHVSSVTPTVAGAQVGEVESMASSLVVTFRTARVGRSFRGRNYVRGFSSTDTGANTIDGTTAASILDAYQQLPSVASPAGYTWVIRSGQVNGVAQIPAITTPVVSVDVRSTLMGNQRRSIRRP
jgi:hypothetical protein